MYSELVLIDSDFPDEVLKDFQEIGEDEGKGEDQRLLDFIDEFRGDFY